MTTPAFLPFHSWRDAHKHALGRGLAAVHRAWCADWLPARAADLDTPAVAVCEPEGRDALASEDAVGWWIDADPIDADRFDADARARAALASRLFGAGAAMPPDANRVAIPVAGIAQEVVQAAWSDWLQRLGAILGGRALSPMPGQGAPEPGRTAGGSLRGSGALVARWAWCGKDWRLYLPRAAALHLLGDAASPAASAAASPPAPVEGPPPVPLDRALGNGRVELQVLLAGTRLDLGQLRRLAVGDVVPLSHALGVPARVVAPGGVRLCDGWLGQLRGRVAVELAPAPDSHA